MNNTEAKRTALDSLDDPSRCAVCAVADAAIAEQRGMVPDTGMDYAGWLDLTGMDDSFVGDGRTIPGTADLYAAAMRAFDVRLDGTDAATDRP